MTQNRPSVETCKAILNALYKEIETSAGQGARTIGDTTVSWTSLSELNMAVTYWRKRLSEAMGETPRTIRFR